jgi:hypothetical protein
MKPLRIAAVQLEFAPNVATAVGNYWLPDEPAAVMPPLSPFTDKLTIRKLRDWDLPAAAVDGLLSKNRKLMHDQLALRLKQILEHCAALSCDLVVLPEAAIPPSAAQILEGYAENFAIFAGLGRIRPTDLDALRPLGITREHIHKNCSVFLTSGIRRVVSKRRLADGERVDPGKGIDIFQIMRGERTFGIAAAICKDYLADSDRMNDAPFPIDIDLIGALSRNTDEFINRTPRHLRVFANHASYGGTGIQVAHLQSLVVPDRHGSVSLPKNTEGLVVVDYYDSPRLLTTLQATYNRLIARSEIVYDDEIIQEPDRPSAARMIKNLRNLAVDHLNGSAETAFLEGAARYLAQSSHPILAESVRLIRANQMGGDVAAPDLESLTQHILLTDVASHPEIRYGQIENLLEVVLAALVAPEMTRPGLGEFRDDLLAAKQDLLERVRPQYRSPNDRMSAAGGPSRGSQPAGESRSFYAVGLARYDALAAVRTLPLQLDVLRTLAAQRDPSISLTYRLVTRRLLTAELVPFLECTGQVTGADPGKVESLREGIGQLLAVTHAAAYDIADTTPPAQDLDWEVEIRPRSNTWVPPISHDWAPLVDLLRAQANAIELTMTCTVHDEGVADDVDDPEEFPFRDAPTAERFVTEPDKKAAEFLSSLVTDSTRKTEPKNLRLSFTLRSAAAPPDTLITSIGLRLVGSLDFDTSTPTTNAAPVTLRPSQAIRVFHPPYGLMQGRGIPTERSTVLPLPAIQLPGGGISLGTATLSSARNDRDADVRLGPEARLRHIYVVGRTGTGKTNFLKTLARQDIHAGAGVAVIDPHGDLVDYLLRHVNKRVDEVLLLDFGDPNAVPVLNPIDLDVDDSRTGSQRLAIDDLISLLGSQSFHEFYGPRFEDVVRLTLESLLRSSLTDTPTVLDVTRVLRSKDQRQRLAESLSDPDLIDRWRNFEAQSETNLAELIHWVLAKFSDMDQDGVLGPVLGGGRSSVSITKVVKQGGILLVRIPEWDIGPAASSFIGALIQERLRRATFERFSSVGETIDPFYLYVDEFQRFATSGFEHLVAEARKFGLGLVLAHQNLRQLEAFSRFTGYRSTELLEAILGNVANMAVLGLSTRDAQDLAREFGVEPRVLGAVPANSAVAQIDFNRGSSRTFTLRIPYAESDPGVLSTREAVRRRMAQSGLWRSREDVAKFLSENQLAVEGQLQPFAEDETRSQEPAVAGEDFPPIEESGPMDFLDGWRRVRQALRSLDS